MLKKSRVNDLIKITGRSYMPLEDRPVYLIIQKIEKIRRYDFLLLDESGKTFWTSFFKKVKDGDILIL